jgi:hypothetical protein
MPRVASRRGSPNLKAALRDSEQEPQEVDRLTVRLIAELGGSPNYAAGPGCRVMLEFAI